MGTDSQTLTDTDLLTARHTTRLLAVGLDFELHLPLGWQAETAAGALPEDGKAHLLWQACSADHVQCQQLCLQLRGCSQTALPQGQMPLGSTPDATSLCLAHAQQGSWWLVLQLHSPPARQAEALALWRQVAASWRVSNLTMGQPAPKPAPARNTWWPRAQDLQAQGRIEEALALVQHECQEAGGLLAQAELWALHRRWVLAAGRLSEALRAEARAVDLACAYAACATSGGEGAARSLERDKFLAQMGLSRRG